MSTAQRQELPRLIALVGCTGSGKTGLGVWLARALECDIISVDSMAIYRGMDIGTAKPSMEERDGVVHHLIDVAEPNELFTVADFVAQAVPIIARLHRRGRPVLLVGGTGLYLRALIHGLVKGPEPDLAWRKALLNSVAAEAGEGGGTPLHRRLEAVDPESARRLHPRDQVRLVRALEVFHKTGKPLSAWQAEHRFADARYRWIKLALELPRETVYAGIDRRVEEMVAEGIEAETRGLLARFGPEIRPMRALGYAHFAGVVRGEWEEATAVLQMQRDTRRFARRQLTWFRGEQGVVWVPPIREQLLERARKFLEK